MFVVLSLDIALCQGKDNGGLKIYAILHLGVKATYWHIPVSVVL
jgi:hypothetical protein